MEQHGAGLQKEVPQLHRLVPRPAPVQRPHLRRERSVNRQRPEAESGERLREAYVRCRPSTFLSAAAPLGLRRRAGTEAVDLRGFPFSLGGGGLHGHGRRKASEILRAP